MQKHPGSEKSVHCTLLETGRVFRDVGLCGLVLFSSSLGICCLCLGDKSLDLPCSDTMLLLLCSHCRS